MLALTVGALLALALFAPTMAGGWAVTTVEGVPDDIVAGATYDITYTMLQHGDKPVDMANTGIVVYPPDGGAPLIFQGTPTGEPGQYTAQVTFPTAGAWRWEADQGGFGPFPLGTLPVTEASATGVTFSDVLTYALPLLALVTIGLFTAQLVVLLRNRKSVESASEPMAGWQRPVSGD
jgi:hypothetical protein